MSDKTKETRGRPTKKTPEVVAKIMEKTAEGKTLKQVAEIAGVGARTISGWIEQDFEFSANLKENRQIADDMVEASLFKRATGYNYTEEASTREGILPIQKHAPPDATSMIFWLKNRRPTDWKDRVELQLKPTEILKIKAPDGKQREFKR